MYETVPDLEAADAYCLRSGEAEALLARAPWRRFVALGDSVAEGPGDPLTGYRKQPWLDRVAAALASQQPTLFYRNLGRRGLTAAEVRARQLESALALAPDLAVVAAGGNDILAQSYDADAIEAELERMVVALRGRGAAVLTVGLFDITRSDAIPNHMKAPLRTRLLLLAGLTRRVAERHGALHLDFTSHPASADAGIYSSDRIHLNSRGHAIAAAATVRSLGAYLAGADVPPR